MNSNLLKKRIEYFFSSYRRGRQDVSDYIKSISNFGPTMVIGGMLRDLAIAGNREFYSDIDLVINPKCSEKFDDYMLENGAEKNRYGGYQSIVGKWKVDIWPLERTWAKVEGYEQVECFQDLLKITFFNWDAILYDFHSKNLITSKSYFHNLENRILDINLEPSLNPLGNAVRAIRALCRHDAKFSFRLADYTYEILVKHTDQEIMEKETSSYQKCYIQNGDLNSYRSALEGYLAKRSSDPFTIKINKQMKLPLDKALSPKSLETAETRS